MARTKKPTKRKPPAAPTARWVRQRLMGKDGFDGDPAYRAQQLVYDAWETASAGRRAELARQAIGLWPDCADAYNLLAEETSDLGDAIALFHQAVEAGERALGKRAFKEDVGHFWGILETRPYMRARAGLAARLWRRGERDAAVGHYRELLRLNPNDNQGIRYLLAACLVVLDRDDDLSTLLDKYEGDAMAAWAYAKALLAFRREGDSTRARRLLRGAMKSNPHIPAMLLLQKRPKRLPDLIGLGDQNEAIAYVADNLDGWQHTPGALEWLALHV